MKRKNAKYVRNGLHRKNAKTLRGFLNESIMRKFFPVSGFPCLFRFAGAGWLLVTSFIGCGYTSRSVYRGPYKTVFVEPFANKVDILSEDATSLSQRFRTYYPLLETNIRTVVINRFMYDGGFRIATKDDADLILKGDLIDYQRDALRYENNQEDVAEYRISLIMRLTLIKRGDDTPLWDEPNFVGDATYFTGGTQAKTEKAALDDAIADLARRVLERLVENW